MRTFIHSLFFSLLIIGLAVSCKSRKPAEPVVLQTEKVIRETLHDTVFTTKADSAFYYSWIECQNNKPVLLQNSPSGNLPQSKPGAKVSVKTELHGNVLKVSAEKQAEQIFAKWKEKYISEQKPVIVPKPYPVEKSLNFWQKLLMKLGWLAVIELLSFVAYIVLKIFKKI